MKKPYSAFLDLLLNLALLSANVYTAQTIRAISDLEQAEIVFHWWWRFGKTTKGKK